MPGSGNCIEAGVAGRREGPVGLPSLDTGRGVVDRRSDQGVGELHLRREDDQSGGLRRLRGGLWDAEGGLDDGEWVATSFGNDARRHSVVDGPTDRSLDELIGVLVRQAGDSKAR